MVNSIKRSGQSQAHVAVAIAGLTVACGGDADQRVTAEVDTIGGVVVVRNGAGLWRESEQWQVVEDFRVGGSQWGENPDEELSYSKNTSVTLGPNGQIFVAASATSRVVVFSGDGEFVRSFGRAGEGPGEFRNPSAMAWDGSDRLWVAEGMSGRYHVFDSIGTYQKSVRGRFITSRGSSILSCGSPPGHLSTRVRATTECCCTCVSTRWDTSSIRQQRLRGWKVHRPCGTAAPCRPGSRSAWSEHIMSRVCGGAWRLMARSGRRCPDNFDWSRPLEAVTHSGSSRPRIAPRSWMRRTGP